MTRNLTRCQQPLYYVVAGENFPGPNPGLWGGCTDLRGDCSGLRGDCSGLSGDCSGLRGDCSGLRGDCTGLSGDCSGLRGDCTDLSGDLDACEITDAERRAGIDIERLVAAAAE